MLTMMLTLFYSDDTIFSLSGEQQDIFGGGSVRTSFFL